MDDEDLEAQIAAKQVKKKKKKKSTTDVTEGEAELIGADGEVVRKKKKKKKKPKDEDGVAVAEGEGGEGTKKKRKKKKPKEANAASGSSSDNNNNNNGEMMAATAAAVSTMQQEDEDAKQKSGWGNEDDYYDNNDEGDNGLEMAQMQQHEKFNDDNGDTDDAANIVDQGDTMDGTGAYCFEADTEIMAEINQDGLVQVDESGGIQAFVAETIAIEGDAVGVIKSDAEIEKEEKKKYTKYFCGAVVVLVLVITSIAVQLVLKFGKGASLTVDIIVTSVPTSFPSLMPSGSPSTSPTSIRYMDIVRKLEPLSGDLPRKLGTPQYHAAMWMADKDPIPNLSTGSTGLNLDDPQFEQRYIMALFYFAMDGPNWENNNGWLSEESECYWFGVDGASDGCGGDGRGGCIKRSDLVGDYDKVCRIGMGEFLICLLLLYFIIYLHSMQCHHILLYKIDPFAHF